MIGQLRMHFFWALCFASFVLTNACSPPVDDDDTDIPKPTPTDVPDPEIQVEPSGLAFDEIEVGDSSTIEVSITNVGGGALEIDAIDIAAPALSEIYAISPQAPYEALEASDVLAIEIEFKPLDNVAYVTTLSISSNIPDSPSVMEVTGTGFYPDNDLDGFTADVDCNDDDDTINSSADEVCDGADNNCDEVTDTDAIDRNTFYADIDGDTFGDPDGQHLACELASGLVVDNTDCDDGNAAINPGATEVCNEVDDDCDDSVDEDVQTLYYLDADDDGHGTSETTLMACTQPPGYVVEGTDCNDLDPAVHPAADELCDTIDNNCDGDADGDDAVDQRTWYLDADGDGFGTLDETMEACDAPQSYVANGHDCDDRYLWGEEEVCDGWDNDCDGDPDLAGGYPALQVPGSPVAFIAGDWDDDGYPDLAISPWGNSEVLTATYTGGGSFAIKQAIAVTHGLFPDSMASGDWDNDGDTDLVTVHSNGFEILDNDGAGTFRHTQSVSTDFSAERVAAGDFDGDGDTDLALTRKLSPYGVEIFVNEDGVFSAAEASTTEGYPSSVKAADLDADGDTDLVVTGQDTDSLHYLMNDGTGAFVVETAENVGDGPNHLAIGDWNGDGTLDLAVAFDGDHTIGILEGDGGGGFLEVASLQLESRIYDLAVGDVDSDGDLDLAATESEQDRVHVLVNDGAGDFSSEGAVIPMSTPTYLAFLDADVDGDPDLVVACSGGITEEVIVVVRNEGGSFVPEGIFEHDNNIVDVGVADFNGDGLDDLMMGDHRKHTITVYLQDTDGEFAVHWTQGTYYYPSYVVPGDFDGDGDMDAAVASGEWPSLTPVYILLNTGTGEFNVSYVSIGQRLGGLTSGDWDGDGDLDLFYGTIYNGDDPVDTVGTLLNDGSGSFALGPTYTAGNVPRDVIAADWDLDGDLDVAVTNYGDNTITILDNDGTGTFVQASLLDSGDEPESSATGDYNGDGYPDLAVANRASNTAGVFLNDGTGSFFGMVEVPTGQDPLSITHIDIDGDGDLDLAVPSSGDGLLSLAINDGAGRFTEAGHLMAVRDAISVKPVRIGAGAGAEVKWLAIGWDSPTLNFLSMDCD